MLRESKWRSAGFRHPHWQLRFHFALICILFASLPVLASQQNQQDKFNEYKEKYDKETDPVRKAKALGNYGDAQIAEFSRAAGANDYDGSYASLNAYRNEVHSVFDALKATGNNAEKKPEGFKELQIHLRKSLWEIDRTMPLIPLDRRPDFENARDELGRIHSELIQMLFPREPGRRNPGAD
jgi:hypothetical protein